MPFVIGPIVCPCVLSYALDLKGMMFVFCVQEVHLVMVVACKQRLCLRQFLVIYRCLEKGGGVTSAQSLDTPKAPQALESPQLHKKPRP